MSNYVYGIVAGEWGEDIILTAKDTDGNIQDISGFSAASVITTYVRSPMGRALLTLGSTLVATGTDGQYAFCFSSNQTPDLPGEWRATTKFELATQVSKTYVFIIDVAESV